MLVKYISDKKEQWDQFLDMCTSMPTILSSMTLLFTLHMSYIMFGREAVLPIALDTCKIDAATILQQFNAAPGLSPSVV